LVVHCAALLLTQTRGAWIAAIFAAAVLGVTRRSVVVVLIGLAVVVTIFLGVSADWAALLRERMQSVFRFDASLSGFDSSVIRVALGISALQMFLSHPLTGIGLKGFTVALPYYAPDALPLAVAMGSDQVLTTIEGPHSTYLSLLAETGIVGLLAFVGWVTTSWVGAYRWYRSQSSREWTLRNRFGFTVLGGVSAIVVFNFFGEMNASGAIPLIVWLSLAQGLDRRPADIAAARG